MLLYTDGIFQSIVKKKGPQRQEALKEFSKYARAQVDQARQAEKVHCYCENIDRSSHFLLQGRCRCERTHQGLQGFETTPTNQVVKSLRSFLSSPPPVLFFISCLSLIQH
jgi:hypothetical protein